MDETTTANGTLTCYPPISPTEWANLHGDETSPHLFTLATDADTITVTSTGDPADLFAELNALVTKLGTLKNDWRTFNGRVDVHHDGAAAVWGIWGHDVVDLHLEDPEPLVNLLEDINSDTADWARSIYDENPEHLHFHDVYTDLGDSLGEYHAGIAGALYSRTTRHATLPPDGSPAYKAACELGPDAVAAYTTGLLAQALGIADAWKRRIAARAAERGLTRCDLTDPTIQAAALRTGARP